MERAGRNTNPIQECSCCQPGLCQNQFSETSRGGHLCCFGVVVLLTPNRCVVHFAIHDLNGRPLFMVFVGYFGVWMRVVKATGSYTSEHSRVLEEQQSAAGFGNFSACFQEILVGTLQPK